MDRRNLLYAKGDERTQQEDEEMSRLSHELSELGFANDFKDPMYDLFVKRMAKMTQFHKVALTLEEQAAQDAAADEIIRTILQEDEKPIQETPAIQIDSAESDYGTRAGYDPVFLNDEIPLPSMTLAFSHDSKSDKVNPRELRYLHFSALMADEYVQALFVATNVELIRHRKRRWQKDKLILDPRIAAEYHFFEAYSGHLIPIPLAEFQSIAWGNPSNAKLASYDVRHTTNCFLVAKDYWENRPSAWTELNDIIFKDLHIERLSEFIGPVNRRDDPVHKGTTLPTMFFKVVVFSYSRHIRSLGFLLDLSPSASRGQSTPSGQLSIVPISKIESLTGLNFGTVSGSCLLTRLDIDRTSGFDWAFIINQLSRLKD